MSGGQDPATWDYHVEFYENLPLAEVVRRYLSALERCDVVETYRLRREMGLLVGNGLKLATLPGEKWPARP